MIIGNYIGIGQYYSQSGGETEFSGFSERSTSPLFQPAGGTEVHHREQDVHDYSETHWAMTFMVGDSGPVPGARLGIAWAIAPKANFSHDNWERQNSPALLLESDTEGWDVNIDTLSLCDKNAIPGHVWWGVYGDYNSGKIGIAYSDEEAWTQAFTKHEGNPIIDLTSSNKYPRHPDKLYLTNDVVWFITEVRIDAPNNPGVTNRYIAKYSCALADFPGETADWTETILFQQSDFEDEYLAFKHFMMPGSGYDTNGRLWLAFFASDQDTNITVTGGTTIGIILAYSDDDGETWEILTRNRPFIDHKNKPGTFDMQAIQEPSLFFHDGVCDLMYNGRQGEKDFQIGYFRLTRGTWTDELLPNIFEDNFDGESLNTTKWPVNNSPVDGITVTQERGRLFINTDGSETAAIQKILEGGTSWMFHSQIYWGLVLDHFRDVVAGGDIQVRISNADGTNYIAIGKGSTRKTVQVEIVIDGQSEYDEEISHAFMARLGIFKAGPYLGIWEENYTAVDSHLGGWIERTLSGDSLDDHWFSVADWPDEEVKVEIWAANESGTASELRINDLMITQHFSLLHRPYVISDVVQEFIGDALSARPNASASLIADIESKALALCTNGETQEQEEYIRSIAYNLDYLFYPQIDESEANVDLRQGIAATVTNAVWESPGKYQFNGSSSSIATNFHLRNNALRLIQNRALVAVRVRNFATLGANRTIVSVSDGTSWIRISYRHSDQKILFRLNGTTTDFVRSTAGVDADMLIVIGRSTGQSSGVFLDINGVSQTISGGSNSNGVPNGDPWLGADEAGANYFADEVDMLAIGSSDGYNRTVFNQIFGV